MLNNKLPRFCPGVNFMQYVEAGVPSTPSLAAWSAHLATLRSWLDGANRRYVESWFATLTKQQLRRGAFRSVDELLRAIDDYLARYNATPTRFVWTKDADIILSDGLVL